MAIFKIFYSWQSDIPKNLCRTLIRHALDDAKAQIEDELEILDAARKKILIDQDTQGATGSPRVAETILQKISECDVFIADLTFVHSKHSKGEERYFPNPNVLLEYGYALHALGEDRIIGVFNKSFGDPQKLPFDLQHRRWPIQYITSDSGSEQKEIEHRQSERKKLSAELANALRPIIEDGPTTADEVNPSSDSLENYSIPFWERYPWSSPLFRHRSNTCLEIQRVPAISLSLRPQRENLQFSNAEIRNVKDSLEPLAFFRGNGKIIARSQHGAAWCIIDNDESRVLTASMVTRSGSLHGIDCYHPKQDGSENFPESYLPQPLVEKILVAGLRNFLMVAQEGLSLNPPLKVIVSLEGIEGFFLAVDPMLFSDNYLGPILVQQIVDEFTIDSYAADPETKLIPFFNKIFDEVDQERPEANV